MNYELAWATLKNEMDVLKQAFIEQGLDKNNPIYEAIKKVDIKIQQIENECK